MDGTNTESATQEKLLSDKLAEIVHHAEMMTGASGAAIALKEGDSLVTYASTGTTAPDVGSRSKIRGSFTGLVIETGEPVRCDDSDNDHRVDPTVCRALQTRSIVVVPVKVDAIVSGVLAVFASSPHSFSNVHVSAIRTLAEIAGDITAKYRPATEASVAPVATAQPHLEINRVSLEEIPGAVEPEEFAVEVIEQAPAVTPETPAFALELAPAYEPVVPMQITSPVDAAPKQSEIADAQLIPELPKKVEPVIGPGSFSQATTASFAGVAGKIAEVIELPTRTIEIQKPGPVVPGPAVSAKAEPIAPLAMSAPAAASPLTAPTKLDVKVAPALEPPAAKKADDLVLSLADDLQPNAKLVEAQKQETASLASWDRNPRREFNLFKAMVPIGLAAALLITGWLYFTKWRHHEVAAEATETQTQQVESPAVVDPITAAAHADEAAKSTPSSTSSNTQAGVLHPASLSAANSPAKPPEQAKPEGDLEPEVVVTGPKPLVVQNAGAPALSADRPAQVEAPRVVASANGVLPLLNIKADVPALKAKQSSLVPNQLMKSVAPLYPEAARRLGLAGPVTVEAHIGSDGNVKSVDVIEGEPVLARAAMVAVKQWKYRPSYLNGDPVASTAKITLNFKPQPSQQ